VYREALVARAAGHPLSCLQILHPFLVRTVEPRPDMAVGRALLDVERLGKRLVFVFEGDLFLALHLMVAGRLHWLLKDGRSMPRGTLAALDFDVGRALVSEAGKKRRASLHVMRDREALRLLDAGGLEIAEAGAPDFKERLARENRTLKRALTDPRIFSGIGNAYSDEILHRARLSPFLTTQTLGEDAVVRLERATREVLHEWTERLRREAGGEFPEKVTAFREGMAVHGRYGLPCPECGTTVQRIRYAENECNYCPRCQTEGRLLADRARSRLLKGDWPRTIDELEAGQPG